MYIMKKHFLLFLLIIFSNLLIAQTNLARWNKASYAPTVSGSNFSVSNLTSTVALSASDYWMSGVKYNVFQTSNWPDKNRQTIDTSKYIQLTISPKNGYKLNLNEFNFRCIMQGGTADMRVDYSLNSNFSNPQTVLQTSISSTMTTFSITNFPKPIATDGQVLYLRIYVYNTWNAMQILFREGTEEGPVFKGTIESSSTVPQAYDDTASTTVNNDIDINVLSNDDYSNKVNSITYTQPSHGTTSLNNNNTINYLPAKNYLGTDSFSYYITNEYGVSNTATVSVTVGENYSSRLIRWDNSNFYGTAEQSFVNSTPMTWSGVSVTNDSWSTPIFNISNLESSSTVNTSKYVQFVLDNTSSQRIIEPKKFSFTGRGTNNASYQIRYSKDANFINDVSVLSSGTFGTSDQTNSYNFDSSLKVQAGEKLYVRLYLYNSYAQYVIQYNPNSAGPAIEGLFYNTVFVSNDTIWLDASNPHWSNGTPNATKNAIIETDYDTATYSNFESSNLTVNNGGSLTISGGGFVTVHGQIINNANATDFVVEHAANLLQEGTSENIGNITVKKEALIPKMGYNYWSSPVAGQNLYQFSEGYNQATTTGTGTPWNRFYVYNEANDYFVTSIANDITLSSTSLFQPSRGYAIRGKNSFPTTVTSTTEKSEFTFTGVPQNGNISSYILKWTNGTHGYNMVGNPYPSNINFEDFYALNSSNIFETVYFWTNNDGKILQQQSSNYSGNNYATLNGAGGISATYYGNAKKKPTGSISVGQGFIIQSRPKGKNQPLIFNNSIRTSDEANYYNKTASQKDRFWLEFKSPYDINNEILIGYFADATDNFDTNYDTELLSIGNDSFWSILDNKKLGIQAKQYPLSQEDKVKLGFKASAEGNYIIGMTDKEGLFNSGQQVLIKDYYLNKTIDITNQAYTFYTSSGQYEDRFEIIYKNQETLSADDTSKKGILIYKDTQNFIINADENLDEVSLYDFVGRLIYSTKNSKKQVLIDKTNLAEGVYVVKAKAGNTIVTKKVLK